MHTQRVARTLSTALFALNGALLLVCLPVVGFMVLWSGWEGGDEALKHRLAEWGILGWPIELLAGALLIWTAIGVAGQSSGLRLLLAFDTGLLVVLAAGWAWVYQGDLLADPSMLAVWTALCVPGVVAALLTKFSPAPAPSV